MTIFENWIEDPLSNINHELQSAINFAELYWQGLDPRFDLYSHLFFSLGFKSTLLSFVSVFELKLAKMKFTQMIDLEV